MIWDVKCQNKGMNIFQKLYMTNLLPKHFKKVGSEKKNTRAVNIYINVGVPILSMSFGYKFSCVGFSV